MMGLAGVLQNTGALLWTPGDLPAEQVGRWSTAVLSPSMAGQGMFWFGSPGAFWCSFPVLPMCSAFSAPATPHSPKAGIWGEAVAVNGSPSQSLGEVRGGFKRAALQRSLALPLIPGQVRSFRPVSNLQGSTLRSERRCIRHRREPRWHLYL